MKSENEYIFYLFEPNIKQNDILNLLFFSTLTVMFGISLEDTGTIVEVHQHRMSKQSTHVAHLTLGDRDFRPNTMNQNRIRSVNT